MDTFLALEMTDNVTRESKEMNRERQMVKKDDSGASSGSTIPLILMQILMQFAHAVMHWHM